MPERLMTGKTLRELQTRKSELEKQVREMGMEGSGHQRASLHDDAASENELNMARGTLLNIGELSGTQIVQPRNETDNAGLGNKVRLQFEDGEETIYLLGRDDAVYRKDLGTITSTDSPLGKAILGRSVGETTEVRVNPKSSFQVKILEILPGEFD